MPGQALVAIFELNSAWTSGSTRVNALRVFGLGFWEIALVLVVALLIFGPAKLPELAKSLGRGLREFRKATDEFKSTIDTELHAPDPEPPQRAATQPSEQLPDTVSRNSAFDLSKKDEEEAEVEPDVGPDLSVEAADADKPTPEAEPLKDGSLDEGESDSDVARDVASGESSQKDAAAPSKA